MDKTNIIEKDRVGGVNLAFRAGSGNPFDKSSRDLVLARTIHHDRCAVSVSDRIDTIVIRISQWHKTDISPERRAFDIRILTSWSKSNNLVAEAHLDETHPVILDDHSSIIAFSITKW